MKIIDRKYAGILSGYLQQYKVLNTNPYSANFRCYVCGDSKTNQSKKRGYIHEKSNVLFYYCHNCFYNKPMWFFLKQFFPAIYDEYVVDSKIESDVLSKKQSPLEKLTQPQQKVVKKNSPLKRLKKISQLNPNNLAKRYVEDRKIPKNQHYRIYLASKWKEWINSIVPNHFSQNLLKYDEPRLVFPLIDRFGDINGVNGRSFNPNSKLKYQTIMFNPGQPKMFGLDKVDFKRKYYVVEGPIDSLFIDNCVAMVGGDANIRSLENVENAVFIWDNEPRNKVICNKIEKTIEQNRNVVIWPEYIPSGYDINDLVRGRYDLLDLIDNNSYSGLEAQLLYNTWRKS